MLICQALALAAGIYTADTCPLPAAEAPPPVVDSTQACMQAAAKAAAAAQAAAEASARTAQAVHKIANAYDSLPSEMPALSPWSYTIGINLMAVSGNAMTLSSKLDAGVEGHWRDWSTELRLSGAYGETSDPQVTNPTPEVTAYKGEVTLRGQRNYNPVLGVYLLTGGMFDRVASIDWQAYGEGGISLVWFEAIQGDFLRSRLRTSLGFRVTHEHRYQFYPVRQALPDDIRNIYGPTLGANFRFGLNRNAYFTEEATLYQDAVVSNDTRITSATALTAQINQRVSLSLTYKLRYFGRPSNNRRTTDQEIAGGLTWTS